MNNNAVGNKLLSIDKIVYFWSILFILPIIYVTIFNRETVIRNFNYIWGFLFVAYLFYTNRTSIANNKSLPATTISNKALITFFITIFISISYSLVVKLYSFHENAWDFGIFQSMLEAMTHGDFGYSSIVGFYHFSVHQNYILLLILPFYYLLHSPVTLQFITAIAILLQGVILWLIMQDKKLNPLLAFVIVVAYFLSPFNGIVCGFHPELLAPTFFAASYLFYIRKKLFYFTLMIMLLAFTKEECALYIIGFGIYLLINKKYSYASIAIFIAVFITLLNNFIVQPYFVHKSGMLNAPTLSYWAQWGTTKSEIVLNMLTHPWQIITSIFRVDSGFWKLYGLLGFMLIFDSFILLTSMLPIFLLGTTQNETMFHYGGYYAVMLNIILFISLTRIAYILKYINSPDDTSIAGFYVTKKALLFYNKLFRGRLQQLLLLLIIIFPLVGFGYQRFYPIDFNDITGFTKVRQVLLPKYHHHTILPAANLYPNLLDLPLNFSAFDERDFFKPANRVIVFTPIGDQWPFTKEQLKNKAHRLKRQCDVIGNFYICNIITR